LSSEDGRPGGRASQRDDPDILCGEGRIKAGSPAVSGTIPESGDSDGCCNFERTRRCGSCISKTYGAGSVSGYFDLFGSVRGTNTSEDLSGGSRKKWYKTGRNVGI